MRASLLRPITTGREEMSRTTFAGVVSMARENRTPALCLLAMSAAVLIGLLVAGPALAVSTTFTVNRTTNEADASAAYGVCDFDAATTGNQCTLRAAI